MTNNPKPISILQWNARSLYKSKLTEFKIHLRNSDPSVVLLSETHWVDSFPVSFSSYNIFLRNRNAHGGGVAILVKKSLSASLLPLPLFSSIEAVGISLSSASNSPLNIISVYSPPGNIPAQEIDSLFDLAGEYGIIGGDFNAHHSLWEAQSTSNSCGNSLFKFISSSSSFCLNTPYNLGTRMCPSTAKISTIDLTFSSANLSPLINIIPGSFSWNSDHCPLFINVAFDLPQSYNKPPSWTFHEKKWPLWNLDLESSFSSSEILKITDPAAAYLSFHSTMIFATATMSLLKNPPNPVSLSNALSS